MTTSQSRWLVLIFALIGLGAAGASTFVHYRLLTQPGYTSACDINATVSCTQAYMSEYGSIAGVPVALGGLLYFALVLAIAALAWRPASHARERAPGYIFLLSLPAVAFILYLAYAAFFVLHAFCILCAITYVAVLSITIASWIAASTRIGTLPGRLRSDIIAGLSNPRGLAAAIILVIAAVAGVLAFPREASVTAAGPAETLPRVTDADRAKLAEWWEVQPKEIVPVDGGGAKVVVVKFNDYQCPTCGLTYHAYRPVFLRHSQDVKLVVKHYPLEGECNPGASGGTHRASCEAAAAVIMARTHGTSEKLEDWLFSHLGPPMLTPDQVKEAARDVAGIQDFGAQYLQVLEQVRADAALGNQLKVTSTPTFFINGRRLPEVMAPQYFEALLEIEIKRP